VFPEAPKVGGSAERRKKGSANREADGKKEKKVLSGRAEKGKDLLYLGCAQKKSKTKPSEEGGGGGDGPQIRLPKKKTRVGPKEGPPEKSRRMGSCRLLWKKPFS